MEKESSNPFAAIIRLIRGDTPQGVFADKLGIKQAKYSHYENKRREPSLDELCRIAKTLKTTPNVLLGFESPSARHTSPNKIITNNNSPVAVVNGNGNNITQNIHTSKRKRGTNERSNN